MMSKRLQQGCIALATAFLLSMIITCVSIPRIDPNLQVEWYANGPCLLIIMQDDIPPRSTNPAINVFCQMTHRCNYLYPGAPSNP
jgi:hypothetical protein